jgi:excisionase family DNA binding protein
VTPERKAYSPAEVADLLGVSTRTVQRLLDSGQLAFVKVQSRRRIPAWAVDAFLEKAA